MRTSGMQERSIVEMGAVPGEPATEAIQAAIDELASVGGGTVYFPPGEWVATTIFLRNRITLNLDPAATLKCSSDIRKFKSYQPRKVEDVSGWVHRELSPGQRQQYFFLVADSCDRVTIRGGGTIDGNGMAFWAPPEGDSPWYRDIGPRVHPLLELRHCTNLTLENIHIVDSPGWTVHLYSCDHVMLRGVRMRNHLFGPNTDGFDINGCRDVMISDCHLICGDDCIIIKADETCRSSERIVISNCIVQSNCIGIGIGQEVASGVRQVAISNCIMRHCHRMIGIGSWAGGVIEDVTITNCIGDTLETPPLARPIHIDIKQHPDNDHAPLGTLRNITISQFTARTKGRILITGQQGTWLTNVSLRDIHLEMVDFEDPMELSPPTGKTGSNQYSNRNLEARKQRAALILEGMLNPMIDSVYVQWPDKSSEGRPFAFLWGRRLRGGTLNLPQARASDRDHQVYLLDDIEGIQRV